MHQQQETKNETQTNGASNQTNRKQKQRNTHTHTHTKPKRVWPKKTKGESATLSKETKTGTNQSETKQTWGDTRRGRRQREQVTKPTRRETGKESYRNGLPGCSVGSNLPGSSTRGCDPRVRKLPGEGNGNPLQYSCLGNPMDRGASGSYS